MKVELVHFGGGPHIVMGATVKLGVMERHTLVTILKKYHDIDTLIKGEIPDDDNYHYFAEDLLTQLQGKTEKQSLNPPMLYFCEGRCIQEGDEE